MNHPSRGLVFAIVLATLAILMPFRLSAQELDLTSERAEATPDDNEELYGDEELHRPANTWLEGNYAIINGRSGHPFHLGPTGLWGFPAGQNIWVKRIDPGSPADGKVLPDDVIHGANGRGFPADRDVRYYFAMAITEAETREAGGELVLSIRRDAELIKVPIQLEVMGSFSSTTPYECEKSENIVARAEEYMRKGLRPETGLPRNGEYMYGPWNDSVLFLMAAGNPELQGLVRRHVRNITKGLDAWKAWEPGSFNPYNGWGFDYLKMLFGEYYHLTGDPTVLPYLEAIVNGTFNRGPNPKKPEAKPKPKPEMDWSWPPKLSAYGTHPAAQMPSTMGEVLANEAGLNIDKRRMLFNLKHLYIKRAEHGYVKYCGYGPIPFERRQIPAPLQITTENKDTGTYSSMNGKLGTAAALYSLVDGYEKAVENCSKRCVYAFNRTHVGHGGVWFNGFWTPIGAYHAGPEKCQFFMKNQQWWRELYRDHTGSMWQAGNAKEKKSVLGTGFAIHRATLRKKLRMFGAPRSMFGAGAPAYMKEALAAHRNRDYARAEQLTLELQASGKVPVKDRARASHFLDSVQTLKKSIEYDLIFTGSLLAKGNYALANAELPQLEMVVSPDNPKLRAIAKALESEEAQAQIASAIEQAKRDQSAAIKATGASKEALKAAFKKELACLCPLVKDGFKYSGPKGTRKGTAYPMYPKQEHNRWHLHVMRALEDTPQGWERPTFDDSKWKEVSLPTKWSQHHAALFRTSFEVEDVNAFKSLRVRGTAFEQRNLTLYLNGEVVAKVIPAMEMVFDLKPESLKLLKRGSNTLAIRTQRGQGVRTVSFRLEGIRKNPRKPGEDLPEPGEILPELF